MDNKPSAVAVTVAAEGGIIASRSGPALVAEIVSTAHMSPLAAETMRQIAESQFATPAIEETKRAIEESRRWYASGVLFAVVLTVAFAKLEGAALAWVLVALAAVLGGPRIAEELRKR